MILVVAVRELVGLELEEGELVRRMEREFGLEQGYRRIESGDLGVEPYLWSLDIAMVI